MSISYNPADKFEIKVWDVEFRRAPARTLMARIYQPQGDGPFPAADGRDVVTFCHKGARFPEKLLSAVACRPEVYFWAAFWRRHE